MKRGPKIAVAAVLVTVAVEAAIALPVTFWIGHIVDWIREAGGLGMAAFAVLYVTATVLLLPGVALLNYGLGLTKVRLRDFVLGSFIGMLPGTVLYVYLGSLVTSAGARSTQTGDSDIARQTLYWVGLAATIIVVVTVTRIARRALAEELAVPHPLEPVEARQTFDEKRGVTWHRSRANTGLAIPPPSSPSPR